MTPTDAAKILDLPAHATPEQIETRFNELRAKLEDKIAKAPTPGLKAKYRESLDDITAAFEALTLAADSSTLPMLQRQRTENGGQKTSGGPASLRADSAVPPSTPQSPKKSGGLQFAVVVVIALAVLGGGAWWVMKTRAEEAEKARLATELAQKAAEQKAEAERAAVAAAKLAEEEKVRLAATAKAEEARREQLGLQLRTRISELNITLDALLKSESLAERELSDLKAEERSLQREAKGGASPDLRAAQAELQAYDRYVTWLRDHLSANPARLARAKLDELAGAKAWDEVAAALDPYAAAIKQLQADIPAKRDELLVLAGTLRLSAEPTEVDFILQDTFGRTRSGRTPAEFSDVPFGRATVTFRREGWAEQAKTVTIARNADATASVDLVGGRLDLTSTPFAVDYILTGQGRTEKGRTPAKFPELPAGNYSVQFFRPGWFEQTKPVSVPRAGSASLQVEFSAPGSVRIESTPAGAEVWSEGRIIGATPLALAELPPGLQRYELRLEGFDAATLEGNLTPGGKLELAQQMKKTVLTQEQGYARFWKEASGSWLTTNGGLFGGVNQYVRITPGSLIMQFKVKGFAGSQSTFKMVGWDPVNEGVILEVQGFGQFGPATIIRVQGKTLHWSRRDLSNPQIFERIADSEF